MSNGLVSQIVESSVHEIEPSREEVGMKCQRNRSGSPVTRDVRIQDSCNLAPH